MRAAKLSDTHRRTRLSLAFINLPQENPADGSLRSDSSRRSLLAVGTSRRTEGRFFYSHLAASILKPSSAPMGATCRICTWTAYIKLGNCPKRGASDAPGVYLARLSGPKQAERACFGAL